MNTYNRILTVVRNPVKYCSRFSTKLNKQKRNENDIKIAPDILKFLETNPEYSNLKDHIPIHLLRKYKSPESMYLINKESAKNIAKIINGNIDTSSSVVEINPGFCFLTNELQKNLKGTLYLYESNNCFRNFNTEISKNERVVIKQADLFSIWRLAFQDKLDQGSRVKDLLGDLASEDPNRLIQIVGAMSGLSFVRYLITTVLFHSTTNLLGRPDLYIIMPGHQYEYLTDKQVLNRKHKALPVLFQLLFDYKILGKVPKLHYLPWTTTPTKQLSLINEHYMYIVNIKRKESLPCHPDYLSVLWYFFKPHVIPKTARVIPTLEQWIPGCGVWLITGQDPHDTNKLVGPSETDAKLPHMTIFTEFGDLNLHQKLTVFKRFISWPEFDQCPFKVTMENNLPKFITAIDDDAKVRVGTHIDDGQSDEDISDSEIK